MRRASLWIALTFLSLFPLASAQHAKPMPAEILGSQLIDWSEFQTPQPMPRPVPLPVPDSPANKQEPSQDSQARQSHPTLPFTGTIVKAENEYVLRVSDNVWYGIDDQQKAKLYEGKKVKIAGSLDMRTNILHVTSIEALS